MKQSYFVAGTDTDVGKTYVTAALLDSATRAGRRAVGVKPLATGAVLSETGWENSDALSLKAHSMPSVPYQTINPIVYEPAMAPHVVAKQAGDPLTVSRLMEAVLPAQRLDCDVLLLEGVGGWCVPLNETETMADFAVALSVPVILVVGMRLGCLNHALLTHAAIQNRGVTVAGWIANILEPDMLALEENIQTLRDRLDSPSLGVVGHQSHFEGDMRWL